MADTISELYEKYTGQVGEALEDDRYFQYLFEMVQAGNNTLQQQYRVLHKVVDERWLTVVEEGIEAIFNIVDKPRRFIATSEEVVPVALAKKITADSVRHLSQNTQFIASDENGEIQPTRILNVTTEESYDLYENRFVYHLIQRLFAFVDKRTDVIFWSTGDETCNVMSMESKVDDAYEEISYKVEMTIKNRQSLVENDTDNMDLFKRIDRVRRLSRILRTSSFCDIMNGCAKVRSPIQRTNLMMKDPDYRTCYKLWQFIESYDEVGYTIEEQDSTLQFDEEYLLQMYINMITNYTVFKSLLESDPRHMTELATEKREPVKPKFVKKIEEQIVEDRDIPDVEIRKVFVEEVTQAQIEAEEKLAEETKKREELEHSVNDLEWQLDSAAEQLGILEDTKAQLEEEKTEIETQLEKEQTARKEAEAAVEQADLEARKVVDMAQKEAAEIAEAARKDRDEQVQKAQTEAADAVETAKKDCKTQVEQAKAEAAAAVSAANQDRDQTVEKIRTESQKAVDNARKEKEESIEKVQREADAELEKEKQYAIEKLQAAQKEAESLRRKLAELENEKKKAQEAAKEAKDEAKKARKEARKSVEMAEKKAAKAIEENNARTEKTISEVKTASQKAVEQAEKEKVKALAKAEKNSLSKYILNALQERRERKK
ncbi:DUF2357 domain-containing protein [Blautia faecicola]|uniref:DUF2357 domain-containing protein n=1 Tax=Blautia faecicola TaxID=2509240 RepID=A0A4Q1RGC2_9FIRM|nr:hypothetical protein [Blautia faecicola]RXS74608.1 hypothetical protein ETP43_04900 [Blautia faecicola]